MYKRVLILISKRGSALALRSCALVGLGAVLVAGCLPKDPALETARTSVVEVNGSGLNEDGYPNINLTPAKRALPLRDRISRDAVIKALRRDKTTYARRTARVVSKGRNVPTAGPVPVPTYMGEAKQTWQRAKQEIERSSQATKDWKTVEDDE